MKNENKEWWSAVIRFWHGVISCWSILSIICLVGLFIFRGNIWSWLSDLNNSNVEPAFVGALVAGLIALLITRWQIRKESKIQREAIRDEQLFNVKNRFTEGFLDAYLTLFVEINELINSQKLKISHFREFLEKRTIDGVTYTCEQAINQIFNSRGYSMDGVDIKKMKVSIIKISTLLNSYRYIHVNTTKALMASYCTAYSEENINKIMGKWDDIENIIIAHKSIDGITPLLNDYDKELGVVFNVFQLCDSYITKTIRPFQIETLNHVKQEDAADRINQQACHWLDVHNSSKCIETATKSLKYRKSHEAYQLIGRAYMQKEEYESALKFFNKALCIEQNNFVSLGGKAVCYTGLRNYKRAIDTYVRLLDLNVEGYATMPNLIELFIISGNIENASQYLRLAKEVLPNNTFSLILLEVLIQGIESNSLDKEESIARIKQAIDYKTHPWSFSELKDWLNDTGNPKKIDAKIKAEILDMILLIEEERTNGKTK